MLDPLPILPFTKPASARIRLPGSKSITNRALLLAALSEGETVLHGALFSEDTEIMIDSLRRLGFGVDADKVKESIRIQGEGGRIPNRSASLFVGNAGTAARFLTAFCALSDDGDFEIDGVPQMRTRPMRGLLDALASLGAGIESNDGHFPVRIRARGLSGGRVAVDAAASSQILSALLMVAPMAREDCLFEIDRVRLPFVRMTVRMMEQFGQEGIAATLDGDSRELAIPAGRNYRRTEPYAIEADVTAASYFATLPLVTGGQVTIENLSHAQPSLQGDAEYLKLLETLGLRITADESGGTRFEAPDAAPSAAPLDVDFSGFSDTFLTLAAISPLLPAPVRIRGIAHTRKQETDRVAAMAAELQKLGQEVVEEEDSLDIRPSRDSLTAASGPRLIDTYHDHRFAMSFAILGLADLRRDGSPWLEIRDPGCCAKTFPHFFRVLESVYQRSHDESPDTPVIVTIDGGAATGKSSTGRALSERFNLLHVDTGAFYRTITLSLLEAGVKSDDPQAIEQALPSLRITTRVTGRQALMEVDGQLPGDRIRSPEVNENVSAFAAQPAVRTFLYSYQRNQAEVARAAGFPGLLMEGRDIGSVIFPDADFRFFLQADEEERLRRRAAQGEQDEIRKRDQMDSSRKTAPLVCPPGATTINSTRLTLEEVVDEMSRTIETKLARATAK